MFKGVVVVVPKEGILDPQGKAIEGALARLGRVSVAGVRAGKYFEVMLKAESKDEAETMLGDIAHRILANPVVESFRCTVTEVDGR